MRKKCAGWEGDVLLLGLKDAPTSSRFRPYVRSCHNFVSSCQDTLVVPSHSLYIFREFFYEAPNDYTYNSETILLCNRCACNWEIDSQRILVCTWRSQKVPSGSARITQTIPVRKSYATDVLRNWETNSRLSPV